MTKTKGREMEKKKVLVWGLMGIWLVSAVFMVFIGGCIPQTAPEGGEGTTNIWGTVIFAILILAVMYFLLIRPQRKRQKEHEELMTELRRGDRVITTGGIYGQIESLSQDSVVLKVESGATIRVARNSITLKRKQ
jgi:preprotein translocase subunit YajC